MTVEKARQVYRLIQGYAYEARVRKMFRFCKPGDWEPMDEGTRQAWLRAVKLNKVELLRGGREHLDRLKEEEGPLNGPPRDLRERQEQQPPPPPAKKKPKARLTEAQKAALAYWDELWEIMKAGDVDKGMTRVARLARKDERSRGAALWKETKDFDWHPAVERIADWTTTVLKKLAKAPHVDFVQFQTGESPEIFAAQGWALENGHDAIPDLLAMLRDRPLDEGYDRLLRNRDMQDFLYKPTRSLPGRMWKLSPFGDAEPEVNFYAASTIWDAVTRLGIARALRRDTLNYPRLVGPRARIPMIIGYEEYHFIGCLTPGGWDTDV